MSHYDHEELLGRYNEIYERIAEIDTQIRDLESEKEGLLVIFEELEQYINEENRLGSVSDEEFRLQLIDLGLIDEDYDGDYSEFYPPA